MRKCNRRTALFPALFVSVVLVVPFNRPSVLAQVEAKLPGSNADESEIIPESLKITIADQPKTIDPKTLVDALAANNVSVQFDNATLGDVIDWIRNEIKTTVIVDDAAFSDRGILLSDPITEQSNDEPLYLLLNRLRSLGVSWYVEGGILYLTSVENAEHRLITIPQTIGEFVEAGFKAQTLNDTIRLMVNPDSWDDTNGEGSLVLLGDVMFVRQTYQVHWEIAGLLAALKLPARRTFVNDPTEHETLRTKLQSTVSVNFLNTPLNTAIEEIARQSDTIIQIDERSLQKSGVRIREPITLTLQDQKLSNVLPAMLSRLKLGWILSDGRIVITSNEVAAEHFKVAVFDVRDLCRNDSESRALRSAIIHQTGGDFWADGNGDGDIAFAKSGSMVVLQTEAMLQEVLELIENYRMALKLSKVRGQQDDVDNERTTRYYRIPSVMAEDLARVIPKLIDPQSWEQQSDVADAFATIDIIASRPELLTTKNGNDPNPSIKLEFSVLMILQTLKNHQAIELLIQRIEVGDQPSQIQGGSGRGGGGFGGGYFSLPIK